jgi:hypothetical protein
VCNQFQKRSACFCFGLDPIPRMSNLSGAHLWPAGLISAISTADILLQNADQQSVSFFLTYQQQSGQMSLVTCVKEQGQRIPEHRTLHPLHHSRDCLQQLGREEDRGRHCVLHWLTSCSSKLTLLTWVHECAHTAHASRQHSQVSAHHSTCVLTDPCALPSKESYASFSLATPLGTLQGTGPRNIPAQLLDTVQNCYENWMEFFWH